MRSALTPMSGVGKIDYVAGKADFKVHYDSKLVQPKAIAEACEKAGHPVTIVQ